MPRARVGYELAITISYLTSVSGIIVLKNAPKISQTKIKKKSKNASPPPPLHRLTHDGLANEAPELYQYPMIQFVINVNNTNAC